MKHTATDDQLLDLTKDLIAIPSTADNMQALRDAYTFMIDFIKTNAPKNVTIEAFESNGLPSFVAYKGAERPERFHIILNGHLDVVAGKPAQYKTSVKDGKLYGRGAHDMKAACIIMAQVFCEYVDKVPYALGLQIVCDEELGGLNGTLHQIRQGVLSDFVICGECGRKTDRFEIANEAKGTVFAQVEFSGKTAHGAYPWRGDNAALQASRFAQAIHDQFPTPDEESHVTTVTVTSIASVPGVTNRIPEHAVVKMDARYIPGDPHFKTDQHFLDFLTKLSGGVAKLDVWSLPMYADPKDSFMTYLKQAAEKTEGHEFKFVMRHAGSDGRHHVQAGGQACEFGIAGEDQHGDDEHIPIEAFYNYLATLREFLTITAKTRGDTSRSKARKSVEFTVQ